MCLLNQKHVKVTMKGRGKKCIKWIPPEPDADQWTTNHFESLIAEIEQGFGVQNDVFQMKDPDENEVRDHEDLKNLWDALDDEKETSFRIRVVPSQMITAASVNILDANANPLDLFSTMTMTSNEAGTPMNGSNAKLKESPPETSRPLTSIQTVTPSMTLNNSNSRNSMILSETYHVGDESDALEDQSPPSSTTPFKVNPLSTSRQTLSRQALTLSTLNLAIAPHLATLGNGIGLLNDEEKESCGDLLRRYMDWIEEDRTLVQDSLKDIMRDDR